MAEMAGVAVYDMVANSNSTLPVCVDWCPPRLQPMTSACTVTNATAVTSSRSCVTQQGPGYFLTVSAAGLELLAAVLGLVVSILVARGRRRMRSEQNVDREDLMVSASSPMTNEIDNVDEIVAAQ